MKSLAARASVGTFAVAALIHQRVAQIECERETLVKEIAERLSRSHMLSSSTPSMSLTPGTALGPYQILAPLGAGGMGEVYRARDTRLGRDVAVKVVTDRLAADGRARFEREIRAASALSHPHICAVHDVGEADGQIFFVMELVEGTTLREYARGRELDPRDVIDIGVQIADALEAAHAKGIIHRDIKPGNVLITDRRHVKVADFGLATHAATADDATLEPLTKAGALMGTPQYMAPEVLQGRAADARSDIWSLGVVLDELLASKRVPRALGAIIEHCKATDPAQRFQNAADVRIALENLQSTSRRGGSSTRRWAAAAVLILVVVGALALTLWRRSPELGPRTSTGAPASPNQEANEAFELAMNSLRVQGDVARGQELLERAITLDPHFAEALRYHAINLAVSILNGNTNDTSALYQAEEELRRAAREDPSLTSLPSAQTAVYLMQGRRELAPAQQLDRILQEHPTHRDTIFWRALLFWLEEDHQSVKQLITRILEREPLWSPPRIFLADTLRMEGDVAGAVRELLKVLEQAPNNIVAIRLLAHAYMDANDLAKARELLESRRGEWANNYVWRLTRAVVYAREGARADALAAIDDNTLKFAAAAFPSTLDAAEVYALLGDTPKAVEWLERAVRNGDERLTWFRTNPRLGSIQQDPAFLRIIESIETRRKSGSAGL